MSEAVPDEFIYDVFLSHSNADKPRVRRLAERLRGAGIRVWFDECESRPGYLIAKRIKDGLEALLVSVLGMFRHTLASNWAALESGTSWFRNLIKNERCFSPPSRTEIHASFPHSLQLARCALRGHARNGDGTRTVSPHCYALALPRSAPSRFGGK